MGARQLLESVKFPMYSRRKRMGSLKPVREEPFEMMNGEAHLFMDYVENRRRHIKVSRAFLIEKARGNGR